LFVASQVVEARFMIATRASMYESSLPSESGGYSGTGMTPAYDAPRNVGTKSMPSGITIARRSPFFMPARESARRGSSPRRAAAPS